jgi:uncharacterized protein (DUF2235 family)
MDYANLLIALIILVCLFIVFFTIYILNHHVRRQRKSEIDDLDLEDNTTEDTNSRPEVLHEPYDEQERLSHITTVAPSTELLSEIRTSNERAENWLERRDSQVADGNTGKKTRKALKDKNDGSLTWDWKGVRDRSVGRKKKDELVKDAGVLSKK